MNPIHFTIHSAARTPHLSPTGHIDSETADEKIARVHSAITNLYAHVSGDKPKFAVVLGTLSFAEQERESVGIELPYNEMRNQGLTVKCTRFGESSQMIQFFEHLANNSEITSFMPAEVGGGYLKGVDQAIADCLRKNQTLQALDVHYCSIGLEGVLNIVNALEQNTALKYLNIRANGISDEILERLLEIVKNNNTTLQRFSFTQNNYISEKNLNKELIRKIDVQLRHNAQLPAYTRWEPAR